MNEDLRLRILEMGKIKKFGHFGSVMSCLDSIKFLYDEVLTNDDIFILSKGHGAPALHAVLESKGFTPPWTVHNEYDEKNGIKATTGSLGLGLPTAIGRGLAKQLKNENGTAYCMVGDGEMQEGVIWESLNLAHRFLKKFVLIVDYNHYQAIQDVKTIIDEDAISLRNKIEAFGFNVVDLNGHDLESLRSFNWKEEKLNCVILHTQKGKGIPFLEKNPTYHVLYQHERPDVFEEAEKSWSKDEV